jgi:hypothetical protein
MNSLSEGAAFRSCDAYASTLLGGPSGSVFLIHILIYLLGPGPAGYSGRVVSACFLRQTTKELCKLIIHGYH